MTTSTSGAAPSLRVTVWRRLKGLGALYLQQSVCLLPERSQVSGALAGLRERVLADGGTMRILPVRVAEADHQGLVTELNAARDEEYAEVLERLPSLLDELAHERARGRLTFEELEENEVDLARFRSWANRIQARDYFGSPLRTRVEAELTAAAEALVAFEDAAARAAGAEPVDRPARLRAVQDRR
ncbi:MAG: Chromate resistance protein ChrB [Mycobacteriales bacterium]